MPRTPTRPSIDEMFTMEAPARSVIASVTALIPSHTPVRFTSRTRWWSSIAMWSMSATTPIPALLISTSIPPKRSSVAATAPAQPAAVRHVEVTEHGPVAELVGERTSSVVVDVGHHHDRAFGHQPPLPRPHPARMPPPSRGRPCHRTGSDRSCLVPLVSSPLHTVGTFAPLPSRSCELRGRLPEPHAEGAEAGEPIPLLGVGACSESPRG